MYNNIGLLLVAVLVKHAAIASILMILVLMEVAISGDIGITYC